MPTALVTGVNGLVGSNLARCLLGEGYHVRGLIRPGSDRRSIKNIRLELIEGDIRDEDAVRRAVHSANVVFHTAALISHRPDRRDDMMTTAVKGTRNVVDACLRSGTERLLHVSSVAALGVTTDGTPIDEETPFDEKRERVGYRLSKHRAEREARRGAESGLDVVVINPAVIIGPGDYRFHGGRMIRDIRKKRIFYAPGGGTSVVDVDDVARGALAAVRRGRSGHRYVLTGQNFAFSELFDLTARIVGGIPPLFRVPTPIVRTIASLNEVVASALHVTPWVTRELVAGVSSLRTYSAAKAMRELGVTFRPTAQTIRRTFEWYLREGLLR